MELNSIWNFKIQLVPIILSLLIVELPNFIRRYKKIYYIPLYFNVFPLRDLNPNLALYLGDDYYYNTGPTLTDPDLKKIKKKIIIDSAISMLISAILIPSLGGFIIAFILDKKLFFESSIAILSYKLINIIRDVVGFKGHAIASKKNIIVLIFIYALFLGVFFQLLNNSYEWARPFIIDNNLKGLFSSLSDIIFNKGIAQGVILAALAALFGNFLTDKNIRNENIRNREPTDEE